MANEQLILNRYRPIAQAGSGGFGTVQVAWDTRIQRRVAIKCIQLDESQAFRALQVEVQAIYGNPYGSDGSYRDSDPHERSDPRAVPAVSLENLPGLDEARTAAMLSDPNIVGVYDFEVRNATAYLIMEYVDGMTLTNLLRQHGDELSLDAIAAIFSSIAHALEVAHDNQVLHLDIKPDNVLINHQGQVKVTDFGLATLSDATGFGTAGGGTIGYMPLEQMRQEALDARCDEWALASLTYEMLTGKNPFLAPDLSKAEAAIEDAELLLPSLCYDGLDAEADDVLFYALDPDREERYDNVEDFSEEMSRFFGNSARGHKELAMLVGQAVEEPEDEEEVVERISLFDRIGTGRMQSVLVRIWAALGVGLLSFVSLSNISAAGGWASPVFWGLSALFVLAGVLKPHLGALLSLLSLSVALLFQEAFVVGILMIVLAYAWWFFVGRLSDEGPNAALAPVLFGSFGFNPISPLVAGFFLSVREAIATAAFAFALSIVLAGFGSNSLAGWNALAFWDFGSLDVQHNMLVLLQQPLTWCVLAGWMGAAAILALLCRRQTRLSAGIGAALACTLMIAALCLGAWFASGMVSWMPDLQLLIPTIGAGVVAVVACAFGVPIRPDEWGEWEE
ncbi:serine/threonine-protein kinase [Raoultibacter massiliensis]|uniref:serine/threonine-protein kinase n=1 Tax=Raoultibacter massiliensis TaxID=1852371 RepID=UPI000C82A564|nr:serine/threonine-protein kinase [Raoultibacter massiliensis]